MFFNSSSLGVPSSVTLTDENKSDLKSSSENGKEDILIQAARIMIASDIPSDLMDLLKMPEKNPPVSDSNLKTLNNPDISAQNNSSNSISQTGVEWSRYRKDNFNRNKLSLVPAGSSMTLSKKKKSSQSYTSIQNCNQQSLPQKSQPKLYQQQNNENQNLDHTESSFDDSQQNSHPDNQITDTFFEIPDSDSFKQGYHVLGQIQTYSSNQQSFQYTPSNSNMDDTKNCINSLSHAHTGPKSQVSSSIKETHSTSHQELLLHTKPKSQISNSIKDSHSTKTSHNQLSLHTEPKSQGSNSIKDNHSTNQKKDLPLNTEKSNSPEVQTVSGIAKENGTNRNYWVNGNGIVGNGSMTHIERLMAIWRNNCKWWEDTIFVLIK